MPCDAKQQQQKKKHCLCNNKSIINIFFLTSNRIKSIIHNIAFSSEKVVSSESGEKYAQTKHHYKTFFDVREWTFHWREAF